MKALRQRQPPRQESKRDAVDEDSLIEAVKARRKGEVAGLFNLIEDRRPEKSEVAEKILDRLFAESVGRGHVIGITGPPGVGKSCLVSRLIRAYREQSQSIGVIAIDPSSRASRGALLGDRIRFDYDTADEGVFVRSMANRGEAGGVSDRTFAGIVALRAAYDVVLVETVGIGQTEADVAALVDTTVLVVQPGSGDVLQFLKAGIMEEPQIIVVNKSDLGALAKRALNDVRAALEHGEREEGEWKSVALLCSAQSGEGIGELAIAAARHRAHLSAEIEGRRTSQAAEWIRQCLIRLYGTRGVASLGGTEQIEKALRKNREARPFQTLSGLTQKMESRMGKAK
jgi:LAO/AO transport system kinase